jgi:hypothetical protein
MPRGAKSVDLSKSLLHPEQRKSKLFALHFRQDRHIYGYFNFIKTMKTLEENIGRLLEKIK